MNNFDFNNRYLGQGSEISSNSDKLKMYDLMMTSTFLELKSGI